MGAYPKTFTHKMNSERLSETMAHFIGAHLVASQSYEYSRACALTA